MTYTFDFNITKNNPSTTTRNNNASKALDNLILSRVKSMLGHDEKREELSFSYTPKKKAKKTIDIDITIPKKKMTITGKTDMMTFAKALAGIMKSKNRDTYDFLLDDGTPIKLFADEIQIGYELFDLDDAARALYKMLSDNRKKEIIDIYITL